MHVLCVRAFVRERERERENASPCMCLCVRVCKILLFLEICAFVRERERERKVLERERRGNEGGMEGENVSVEDYRGRDGGRENVSVEDCRGRKRV